MDQRPDASDDQRHHRAQPVEIEGDLECVVADQGPAERDVEQWRPAGLQRLERGHGGREGQDGQPATNGAYERLAETVAKEPVQQEAEQRQDDDQGQQMGHLLLPPQVREGVGVKRVLAARQQQHDRHGNGDFRRGHDEDQEHQHRTRR